MPRIPESEWKWYGHAAHLIVSRWCRFHLATEIGEYVISTVGEYWPSRSSREIHAKIHDSKWLADNKHLLGDTFDAAYMERFGFEEIGYNRKYETMVFKVTGHCQEPDCMCGMPSIDGSELGVNGYNTAGDATKGHYELCRKWASQ